MQQEMKYIYTVYQKGSFSKAARALYMTQPALSIAVQRVEREIGMPLFRRDHQPLELTEAGKVYIAKIQEIQFLEHQLEQQLGDLSQLKTGCLRIGGTHYFNSYVLPPVLAEYQRHWPGIQVELTEAGSGELISLLKENLIDLTFNCTPDPRDSCHRIPAFRDQVLIAVPVDFPVSGSLSTCAMTAEDILNGIHRTEAVPAVSAADLAEISFLLLTSGNNLYERAMSIFRDAGVSPRIRMQVTQLVTAYHLCCAGIGAAFISDRLVTVPDPRVRFYRLNSPLASRLFDIVTPGKTYVSHAQKAFVQLFAEYYRSTISLSSTADTPSSPR